MFEIPDQTRRRIALRWPSADAFHAERDDRTIRAVGNLYAHVDRRVEIVVDPTLADDTTVQRIALVAANLTARWARRVTVVMPLDTSLHTDIRREGETTLAERVHREMVMADPFGNFNVLDASRWAASEGALRLFIGPWVRALMASESDDYVVHALGWTSAARRAAVPAPTSYTNGSVATIAAAGLAGSLGAADLFKRAIGHARSSWMPTFSWDTWSSELR